MKHKVGAGISGQTLYMHSVEVGLFLAKARTDSLNNPVKGPFLGVQKPQPHKILAFF